MQDAEISAKWLALLSDEDKILRRIVEVSFKEPVLRGLFPYASHSELHFSRKTTYPFDRGMPYVWVNSFGEFQARDGDNSILERGSLEFVVSVVAARMSQVLRDANQK